MYGYLKCLYNKALLNKTIFLKQHLTQCLLYVQIADDEARMRIKFGAKYDQLS